MKHFYYFVLSTILCLGPVFSQANAQVPRTMSYQGVVIDGAGKFIPDGPHNITLNLYDNIGSGTSIYSESHTGVVFVNGIFNVMIGSINPIAPAVTFDRGYFLGVSVDGGAEMNPRTPLSAAPYALHAAIADQALSLAAGATGVVSSVNGLDGAITLAGAGGTTITNTAGMITITSVAGGGGGLTLPFSQSLAGVTPLLAITNTGTSSSGFFNIINAANTSDALLGSTDGTGAGVAGTSSAITGTTTGVRGEANSVANGAGASGGVTGVLGVIVPTAPGGYSAALRGVNHGTGGNGIGAIGYQAGSGWGVYGETPKGFGVYGLTTDATAVSTGVRGETFSSNGVGVVARYSGTGVGTPFELANGAIKVSGTNKAAFVHTATSTNKLSSNGTDIDNPLCNGDPNCILFITQKLNPATVTYNNSPMGVYYNTARSKWEIFNETNVAIPDNAQFNVWVIKQ